MTLTFVLTDVEGSTRLWEAHGQAMGSALAAHDRLVTRAVADHGGRLVKAKGEGDSSFSVFASPVQAVAAALALQRALAAAPWPLPAPLAVRVAVHAGEVQEREADFYGPVVNRAPGCVPSAMAARCCCRRWWPSWCGRTFPRGPTFAGLARIG